MALQREKVIVALSGGVDSAVAAATLLGAGYDVSGVFGHLNAAGGSEQDADDARRVASALGIDLHTLDLTDVFERITEQFAAEYARGRTPNPCIHCNSLIKFGRLIRHADSLSVQYVATGHHGRIVRESGEVSIFRGRAREKDQSYALFAIPRRNLPHILLPIGELDGKDRVRSLARELKLNVHAKPDSQDICFAADGDYAKLLARMAPEALRPGKIVDQAGKVLGDHNGYGRFTIGQRKGLSVAAGEPMYVSRIDPATATVTIGPRETILSRRLSASKANWHRDVAGRFDAIVQIRYNHAGASGRVRITGEETFEVEFAEPVAAVTAGQAAVVYDGDRLLGGGWIDGPSNP